MNAAPKETDNNPSPGLAPVMPLNRGLQVFADSEGMPNAQKLTPEQEQRLRQILESDDFQGLTVDHQWLHDVCEGKAGGITVGDIERGLNTLAGNDRDRFLSKVGHLLPDDVNTQIYDANHATIMRAMCQLSAARDTLPSISALARYTGLSRPTISKHLKEYASSDRAKMHKEQLTALREKAFGVVVAKMTQGDLKAAKIFLEQTDPNKMAPSPSTQNTYIQMNGLVLTEEAFNRLPVSRQQQIRTLFQSLIQPEGGERSEH